MSFSFSDWKAGQKPPKGWDAADAVADGWGQAELDAFMGATATPWEPSVNTSYARLDEAVEAARSAPAPVEPAPVEPAQVAAVQSPVREMRSAQQERPEQATVTHLQTRVSAPANEAWRLLLQYNEKTTGLKPNVTINWSLHLENHRDVCGVFQWDAFKLKTMVMRCPPWERAESWTPRPVQDRDYSEAVMWLEGMGMTPKASNIAAVIQTVAERCGFDRLREYLDGLAWDGVARVETWAVDCLGVKDGAYARAVGKRWLISSVARGLMPGCKVDTMPILEGPQGARKSTAIRILYGDEFFTDELSDIGSKDAMMELQGIWGLEVAEMHRFSAAETNAVKKFLSRQTDRFRPPYGRTVIEAPRRCVLNGTINPEGNAYLRDPTGARRFWPVTVGRIDIDRLARERDQLWAEAVALFRANNPWWVQDDELAAVEVEQEKRTDVDVWTGIVAPLLHGRTTIGQLEIFRALNIPDKDIDARHAGRIGRIMKKLGWEMFRESREGGDRVLFRDPRSDWIDRQIDEKESFDW